MRVSTALLVVLAAPSCLAATPSLKDVKSNIVPGAYIAQFNPGHDSADAFYQNLTSNGIDVVHRNTFQPNVFSGTSFHLISDSKSNLDLIGNFTQVKVITPVRLFNRTAPTEPLWKSVDVQKLAKHKRTVTTSNATFSTHVMTGVDKLHKEGLDGSGIRIAEIDTGIDYTLPALGGCFGPGCKIAFGTDLVGDAYDGTNTPIPDDDPMDCLGHGTHVAGIIAASNDPYVLGVAPNATLGIYKVFGCADNVANDVLIVAFTMAFNYGVDVITSSIGGADGWPEEPWSLATANIVASGTPCMLAGGNDGVFGLYYASAASAGKDVTSVGSVDNTNTPGLTSAGHYIVNGTSTEFPYTAAEAALSTFNGVTLPISVDTFDTTIPDDGCNGFTANMTGTIALIRRGSCDFATKAQSAIDAGANYVMFYNNVATSVIPFVGGPPIIAAGIVSATLGETLVGLLAAGNTVTFSFSVGGDVIIDLPGPVNDLTGGQMSMFSTWNPSNENDIKPVVSAPGGNILSTYLSSQGGYNILSGTSMATPFIAGVVALYKQAKGKGVSPLTINAALAATAKPLNLNDGTTASYPFLTSVSQQGGGLVDAYHMIHAGVAVTEANLAFNDTANHVQNAAFYVQNTGTTTLSYILANYPAANVYAFAPYDAADDTTGMLPATFDTGKPLPMDTKYASLTISPSTLSLKPGEKKRVTVAATPDPSLNSTLVPFYSGYIKVTGGGETITLPYGGVATVMHDIEVLAPNWPFFETDFAVSINGSVATFKPSVFSFPEMLWNTRWATAELRLDVVSVGGKNPVRAVGMDTFGSVAGFPWNWNPRGWLGLEQGGVWQGTMADGTIAPSGTYKLVLRLAKPFADLNKGREFETYESQPFVMDMS